MLILSYPHPLISNIYYYKMGYLTFSELQSIIQSHFLKHPSDVCLYKYYSLTILKFINSLLYTNQYSTLNLKPEKNVRAHISSGITAPEMWVRAEGLPGPGSRLQRTPRNIQRCR